MTLIIHEGKKVEDLFLKDGNIPDPRSKDNIDFNIVKTIIKRQLEGGDMEKWNKIVNTWMGFSDQNFMGVHRLHTMDKTGTKHQN